MKYRHEEYNSHFFATNLRLSEGKVKWDTENGGVTLLLQGKFSEEIDIQKLCEALNALQPNLQEREFIPLAPEYRGVSVRLIDAQQKAKQGGCTVREEVCRYTVYACEMNEDECIIYEPRRKYYVDVPAEVSITYAKVYDRTKGFFTRKVKETFAGFYEVVFEQKKFLNYRDGAIFYKIGEVQIPVTYEMIQAECFYIKADEMPVFRTENGGFRIKMEEKNLKENMR